MRNHPLSDKQSDLTTACEAGGALWFILIAIALLAALTITVTRSTDNAQQNGTRERDRIQASELLRSAKGMAQAVDQARMQNIPENNISFENSTVTGYTLVFSSALAGSSESYFVFASSGSGLRYSPPPGDWLDTTHASETAPQYGEWLFYGTTCIPGVGTGDDATCASNDRQSELIVGLPWISVSLCLEINRQAGVTNLTGPLRPPTLNTAGYGGLAKFNGTYGDGGVISSIGGEFTGKQAGCYAGGASDPNGGYHFFQVLIAR